MPISAAERSRYEARQARLLGALLRGDGYPAGFSADKADAAGDALRRKRARAIARGWPALVHALGGQFAERFDAYARATLPAGGGLADGLAFARQSAGVELSDDARAEVLFARCALARCGLFVGALVRHQPCAVLIALRIPGAGRRHIVVPLSPRGPALGDRRSGGACGSRRDARLDL